MSSCNISICFWFSNFIFLGKIKSGAKLIFQKKCIFFCPRIFFSPNKMWVLESFSKVVAGPFKSQAEMAKKLGVSQQYVNRQIRKHNFRFHLDGQTVIARREKEFVGGGKKGSDKEELAMRLGVSYQAVDKVLSKNSSGFVQTPNGKVRIQKLKPGEKPTLPAVRVLWDDDTEKQDFVSFAEAAKELKIHPKTIPSALKAGRDSFTRKSDGKKFTFEIPTENTPSRKKPKPLSEEQKQKWAEMKRRCEIRDEYRSHSLWDYHCLSIEEMDKRNKLRRATVEANQTPAEKEPQPPSEEPSEEEEEETHSEEEEPHSEEEEPHSEDPPPRPIPAPRKKVPLLQPPAPRPIPAPRKKVPLLQPPAPRPIPAPRKKVPSLPVIPPEEPAASGGLKTPTLMPWVSAEKSFRASTPPEVVEIREAGKTFPWNSSKKLEITTFLSAATLARYIKSGCGKMFLLGPKKHQMFICNNKRIYLPEVVKEVIVFQIRDQMWKDEDGPEAFAEKACEYNWRKKKSKRHGSTRVLWRSEKVG